MFKRVPLLAMGMLGFLSVLRDPLSRGLTLSQALLVLAAVSSLALPRTRPTRCGAICTLPLVLLLCLSVSTVLAFVAGREVDALQATRDIRDLGIFAVGIIGLARWRRLLSAPLWGTVLAGVTAAMCAELALRSSGAYAMLFQAPFGSLRYRAGFLGPNEYGAVASIVLASAVGGWLEARSILVRLWWSVALGVAAGVLLSTLSRGGVAGATVASVAVVGVVLADRNGGTHHSRRLAVVLLLVVAAVVVRGSADRFDILWQALRNRTQVAALGSDVGDRTALLRAAVDIGAMHPLLGGGAGAFAALNGAYGGSGTLSPHNEFAKAFSEGGLLALAILATWLTVLTIAAFRRRHRPLGYAVLGGTLAFVAAEQFFTYLVRPGLSVIACALIANLVSAESDSR